MPRNRRGAQLSIELPPELLARLREEAQRQQRPAAALVRAWIEAGLSAPLEAPGGPPAAPPVGADLVGRIEALEAGLAALQQQASPELGIPASPELGIPGPLAAPPPAAPPAAPAELEPLPERRLTPEEAAGLLPLPRVAELLGLGSGGSAITNWIRRQGPDAVGRVYRGWRLRGKGLLPGGQKPCWLFEQA